MIDVIIPAYNSEKYLPACLESLLESKTDDARIILVDDGSTDSTGAICDAFCAEHKNVLAVHRENGGSPAARNTGVAAAGDQGENHWIWFVDSDDVVAPGALDTLAKHAASTDADALYFNLTLFDDGAEPEWTACENKLSGVIGSQEFLAGTYRFTYAHYLPGFLFRRDALEHLATWRKQNEMAGLCDEGYSLLEDLVFAEEFMQDACRKVELLPDALYGYRQLECSVSHTVNPKAADSALRAMRYIDGFEVPGCDYLAKCRMQIALLFNAYRAAGQDATSAELRREIRHEIESRVRAVGLGQLTQGLLVRYVALKTGAGDLVLKMRMKR